MADIVDFVVILLLCPVLVISQNLTCNSNDLTGLQGFNSGLESPIDGWWSTNSGCCNWVGIICNPSSGRIIRLELANQLLYGNLADSFSYLDQLKSIDLSRNFLKGPLPFSLFNLGNLEAVDLSSNDFSGVLPVTINLPKLQVLDISNNVFSGVLPSGLCVNSTQIRTLSFALNNFTGIIPPQFSICKFLEHLSVSSNFHSGVIPDFLFRLPRLRELALDGNEFSAISRIANFSSQLVRLDVSFNRLSGNLPDIFHGFSNLSYFSAKSNNLSGEIPPSLSNSQTISYLNLGNNSFDGSPDFNCTVMVNITSLNLGTNSFSGTIPANLASCQKLKNLNLARNRFIGQIPETFRNFQSLSYLSLSNCSLSNLSASLKILQHCENLTVLILPMNFNSESLPSDDLQFKALQAFVIGNCRLKGHIPSWLNGLTHLQLLDLSWNHLTGSIPAFLGNLKSLFYLDLSNNSLYGEIPKSLTQLQSLISRDISLDEPFPDFPFFKNRNTGDPRLQYNQIMRFPPQIDLSANLLIGPIWPEFGNLKRLHVLVLKNNNLSGTIPSSLSGMRNIETLDLSYNRLTGTIPSSLKGLSFLSKFSVAYNSLTGTIPSGGQFSTFSCSSFEGNPGLCSDFAVNCRKKQDPWQPPASEDEEFPILHVLVITGFGSGFLATVISLLIVPSFRAQDG